MYFKSNNETWIQKHFKDLIFLLLSIIFLLIYFILTQKNITFIELGSQVLLNLGIVFLSISVISFLWEGLGGEPVKNALNRLRNYLELSTLGIEHITIRNNQYQFEKWKKKINDSKQLYFMGNILRDWIKDISSTLEKKIKNADCDIRILILDPEGDSLKNRAFDEACENLPGDDVVTLSKMKEKVADEISRMQALIKPVQKMLNMLKNKDENNCLKVKLVNRSYITSSVLIIDEDMIVINYLHQTGSNSPLMEINGKNKKYYDLYKKEFDRVWKVSKSYDFKSNDSH